MKQLKVIFIAMSYLILIQVHGSTRMKSSIKISTGKLIVHLIKRAFIGGGSL